MRLKDYLLYEAAKNTHMTHLEDLIIDEGPNGVQKILDYFNGLIDMLGGSSNAKTNITVKWDGAPAIFCGPCPETGKFFVGTKSIFNKTPKINYTDVDVDRNHDGELAKKLKLALKYLPKLGMDKIMQGDMMFTDGDVKKEKIDGSTYLTFQPNTIVYAVEAGGDMAKEINNAKIGIVFHTTYSGKSFDDLSASFGAKIDKFNKSNDIWVEDAYYKDVTGNATLTQTETNNITDLLDKAKKLIKNLDKKTLKMLSNDKELRMLLNIFINSKIRGGSTITDSASSYDEYIAFYKERINKELAKVKTEKAKQTRYDKLERMIGMIKEPKAKKTLIAMFELHKMITKAKLTIVRKLETIQGIGTFTRTDSGFDVTKAEGFVAIDKLTGGAVKLVDRLEFSMNNFNATKNWKK